MGEKGEQDDNGRTPSPLHGIRGGKSRRGAVSVRSIDQEAANPLAEYMVPAADSHGHSARCIVRMPPSQKHQIALVIQCQKFPWQTDSDFLRWAVWRGLREVADRLHDPTLDSMQAVLAGWISAARIQQDYLNFERTLVEVRRTLADLLNKHARGPARKIVAEITDHIHRIDDPYWRGRWEKEVLQQFGALLTDESAELEGEDSGTKDAGVELGRRGQQGADRGEAAGKGGRRVQGRQRR